MAKRILGRILIAAGVVMLALAAVLIYNNVTEETQAGELAAEDCRELMTLIGEQADTPADSPVLVDDMEVPLTAQDSTDTVTRSKLPFDPAMEMPTETIKGNLYVGVLEFPKRELSLPVMSEWSYSALRVAPCRYTGSVYSGDLVVCGHNYSRHFGKLKRMAVGEEIRFTDVQGNIFRYSVCAMEITEPRDVEKMITGDWDLTLFTCTNGGKTRMTVRCRMEAYMLKSDGVWKTIPSIES